MGLEIERKFIVTGDGWQSGTRTRYRQGYLSTDKYRTVRVRVAGDTAVLTIKGVSVGMSRREYEYPIPVADAEEMLELCAGPIIDKWRTRLPIGDLTWEVDEFLGDNAGLFIAEVELPREDHPVDIPEWVGTEVTGDLRYYNARLVDQPYNTW